MDNEFCPHKHINIKFHVNKNLSLLLQNTSSSANHLGGPTITEYLSKVRKYSNKSHDIKQGYESASDSDSDSDRETKGRERVNIKYLISS